jgi:hypothetical protein
MILFSSLCMISALFIVFCCPRPMSVLLFSHIFVLCLFSLILVLSGLPVSCMYFFPNSHGMLYMQFFVSWILFLGLVYVIMLRSIAHRLFLVVFHEGEIVP